MKSRRLPVQRNSRQTFYAKTKPLSRYQTIPSPASNKQPSPKPSKRLLPKKDVLNKSANLLYDQDISTAPYRTPKFCHQLNSQFFKTRQTLNKHKKNRQVSPSFGQKLSLSPLNAKGAERRVSNAYVETNSNLSDLSGVSNNSNISGISHLKKPAPRRTPSLISRANKAEINRFVQGLSPGKSQRSISPALSVSSQISQMQKLQSQKQNLWSQVSQLSDCFNESIVFNRTMYNPRNPKNKSPTQKLKKISTSSTNESSGFQGKSSDHIKRNLGSNNNENSFLEKCKKQKPRIKMILNKKTNSVIFEKLPSTNELNKSKKNKFGLTKPTRKKNNKSINAKQKLNKLAKNILSSRSLIDLGKKTNKMNNNSKRSKNNIAKNKTKKDNLNISDPFCKTRSKKTNKNITNKKNKKMKKTKSTNNISKKQSKKNKSKLVEILQPFKKSSKKKITELVGTSPYNIQFLNKSVLSTSPSYTTRPRNMSRSFNRSRFLTREEQYLQSYSSNLLLEKAKLLTPIDIQLVYTFRQKERKIICNYLLKVSTYTKKKCSSLVYFRAINLLDRSLSTLIQKMRQSPAVTNPFGNNSNSIVHISGDRLPNFVINQLMFLALICYYISSKFDDMYPLNLQNVQNLTNDKSCTFDHIIETEYEVLKLLNFKPGITLTIDIIDMFVSKHFARLGKHNKNCMHEYAKLLCRFSKFFYCFSLLRSDELALLCIVAATQIFRFFPTQDAINLCHQTCSFPGNPDDPISHRLQCPVQTFIRDEQFMINDFLRENSEIMQRFDMIQRLIELKTMFKERKSHLCRNSLFFKFIEKIDLKKVLRN